MSGSIDGKSLGDSTSLRFARQCRANSRPERDLSPSSVYSLNDQPVVARFPNQRLSATGQYPTTSANALLTSTHGQPDANEIKSDNVGSTDNRDPFRVRSLLDNLRQILNDDDELEPTTNVNKVHKK